MTATCTHRDDARDDVVPDGLDGCAGGRLGLDDAGRTVVQRPGGALECDTGPGGTVIRIGLPGVRA